MLTLDKQFTHNGTQVYGDSDDDNAFYVIPAQPRFRTGEDGVPVFTFISYRSDPPKPNDEDLLGALSFFDVEFYPTDAEEKNARAGAAQYFNKNNIVLKQPAYLRGTSRLLLIKQDKKKFEFNNAGKPSLVGRNISSFNMQFNSEWAQVFLEGMSKGGGIVQVAYDLVVAARFSDTRVDISYEANQMKDFLEQLESGGEKAGITKTINDSFTASRLGKIEIHFGAGIKDEAMRKKSEESIRDWSLKRLEEQMQKQLEQITGISADEKKRFEDQAAEEAKKGGWQVQHFSWFAYRYRWAPSEVKSVLKEKITNNFSFHVSLRESHVIEHEITPQGTLPGVTTIINSKTGQPVVWNDQKLNLGSEFFKRLEFSFAVDHPFPDNSPITQVGVKLNYGGPIDSPPFTRASHNPWSTVRNFDKSYEFTYEYVVDYTTGKPFRSGPIKTTARHVTLDSKALGLLHLEIDPAGLFGPTSDCEALELKIEYADTRFSKTLRFRANDPATAFDVPVYTASPKPRALTYTYQFKDGSSFTEKEQSDDLAIEIKHPFFQSVARTVELSRLDEFKSVRLTFEYADPKINYKRTAVINVTATENVPRLAIPARDQNAGSLMYSGVIRYASGAVSVIAKTEVPRAEETVVVEDTGDSKTISVMVADGFWDSVSKITNFKLSYGRQRYSPRKPITKEEFGDGIFWSITPDGDLRSFDWEGDLLFTDKRPARSVPRTKVEGFNLTIDA